MIVLEPVDRKAKVSASFSEEKEAKRLHFTLGGAAKVPCAKRMECCGGRRRSKIPAPT
jgi:hypothetical protein